MINIRTVAMLAVAIGASPIIANASNPTCAAPPYGSSPSEYKAFIDTFGIAIWQSEARAQVFLGAICEAKLSHAPDKLEPLHNLGISNREIDAMTMAELRMRAIREIKARLK